jgi:hypothetical protein
LLLWGLYRVWSEDSAAIHEAIEQKQRKEADAQVERTAAAMERGGSVAEKCYADAFGEVTMKEPFGGGWIFAACSSLRCIAVR